MTPHSTWLTLGTTTIAILTPGSDSPLGALQHLPESRDTIKQAIDLRFDLRNALFALGDRGPILEHLRQAETLAQDLGDRRRLGRAVMLSSHSLYITPLSEAYLLAGRTDEALGLAGRALELSLACKERGHQAWALRLLGPQGEGPVHLQRRHWRADPAWHEQPTRLFPGSGARVCARSFQTVFASLRKTRHVGGLSGGNSLSARLLRCLITSLAPRSFGD